MHKWLIAALAAAVLAPAPPAAAQKSPHQGASPHAPSPHGNAPFAGGGADAKDAAAEKAEAAAVKLEKQLKAKPKDAKLKVKVADAFYQAGHAYEYSTTLPPRAKYRNGLRLYNKALSYDKNHAKAAAEKKQIEDIYKQMGMPVPKV